MRVHTKEQYHVKRARRILATRHRHFLNRGMWSKMNPIPQRYKQILRFFGKRIDNWKIVEISKTPA